MFPMPNMSGSPTPAPAAPAAACTPHELNELKRKVDIAKSILIMDHPFFGSSVSKRPLEYTESVPTASMSATGHMKINPTWAKDLSVKNLEFLLAHEAMHYMFSHSIRRQHRDPEAWNVACDLVINDILIHSKVGEFITGGMTLNGARDMAAEQLYQDPPKGGGSGGGMGGIGKDIGDPEDEDGNALDEAQANEIQAQATTEMLQAAQISREAGKTPAGVERLIEQMLDNKREWHQILEPFMANMVRDDRSWSRPNRRFVHMGTYLPSRNSIPAMGTMVIAIDTSGSLIGEELEEFNANLNRILETCRPESVQVLYCDAAIAHTEEFTPDDFPVMIKPHGGGGTSFKPVFNWVDKNDIHPDVLVYMTDGYGDQHAIKQPSYPVVWLTLDRTDFPWGTVIPVN